MEAPELFSDDLTKAGEKRIAGWTPLTTGETITKNGSISLDTLMYVFNYEGEQGYVVIPTDDLDGEVVAYVEEGSFNIQDTSTNELQKFLVDLMIDYRMSVRMPVEVKGAVGNNPPQGTLIFEHRSAIGPKCDKVMQERPSNGYYGAIFEPPGVRCEENMKYYKTKGCYMPGYYQRTTISYRPPLLTTCWSQNKPFNNKAELIGGKRAYAGCIAIAIAQITAYHSYPKEYVVNGVKYYPSLSTLKNYKYADNFTGGQQKSIIANYVRYIGDLLHNEWGVYPNGTGAYSKDAPGVLRTLGYPAVSGLIDYSIGKVVFEINSHRPVYMRAHGYYTNDSTQESAHAWVIDGYKKFNTTRENVNCYFDEYAKYDGQISKGEGTYGAPNYYPHCNFGWGGLANGYYRDNIFTTGNPDERTDTTSSGSNIVFNNTMSIITNIFKN